MCFSFIKNMLQVKAGRVRRYDPLPNPDSLISIHSSKSIQLQISSMCRGFKWLLTSKVNHKLDHCQIIFVDTYLVQNVYEITQEIQKIQPANCYVYGTKPISYMLRDSLHISIRTIVLACTVFI